MSEKYKFGIWEQINAAAYLFLPSPHEAMDRFRTRRIARVMRTYEDNRKIALWERGAMVFAITMLTCMTVFVGSIALFLFGLLDFITK